MNSPEPRRAVWGAGYFSNLDRGVLSVQECQACRTLQFYPRAVCRQCFSRDLGWREVDGTGRIYSFTWVRYPVNPSFRDQIPICFADIELSEGVRMLSRLNATEADSVEIGAEVRVRLPVEAGSSVPTFDLT